MNEVIFTEQGEAQKEFAKYAFWQNATNQFFGIAKMIANYQAKKITCEIRLDAKWKYKWKVGEFSGSIKFSRTSKGEKKE